MSRHCRGLSSRCQSRFLHGAMWFYFCIAPLCANILACALLEFIFSNRGLYALPIPVSKSQGISSHFCGNSGGGNLARTCGTRLSTAGEKCALRSEEHTSE